MFTGGLKSGYYMAVMRLFLYVLASFEAITVCERELN